MAFPARAWRHLGRARRETPNGAAAKEVAPEAPEEILPDHREGELRRDKPCRREALMRRKKTDLPSALPLLGDQGAKPPARGELREAAG